MMRLEMKNCNMTFTGKLQKDQHYRQVKYKHVTGKQILISEQSRIIEQTNFTYSPLAKAFEKQIKEIEDYREKKIKEQEATS